MSSVFDDFVNSFLSSQSSEGFRRVSHDINRQGVQMQQEFQVMGERMDALHSTLNPLEDTSSDRGAVFGDDDQDNASKTVDDRIFVRLPNVKSPVQVHIWEGPDNENKLASDRSLHQLGVDPGSKFCWASRNYLEQMGFQEGIEDIAESKKTSTV